jgi:hypothetical protein
MVGNNPGKQGKARMVNIRKISIRQTSNLSRWHSENLVGFSRMPHVVEQKIGTWFHICPEPCGIHDVGVED